MAAAILWLVGWMFYEGWRDGSDGDERQYLAVRFFAWPYCLGRDLAEWLHREDQ